MAVIALGGLTGGGARELGPVLAEKIGGDYVDRLILASAARHLGATVEVLHLREQRLPTVRERFGAFLERIMGGGAIAGVTSTPSGVGLPSQHLEDLHSSVVGRPGMPGSNLDPSYFSPGGALSPLTQEFEDLPQATITKSHRLEDEAYIRSMRHVIRALTSYGNVVIVGRGSVVILRDNPKVLRVGCVASYEDRIARVMQREDCNRKQAEKTLKQRDEARAKYFKVFFDLDNPDEPMLYHLVINTSDVDMEYAADMVFRASEALQDGRLIRRPSVSV